jgi:polar amino acid transport system substrate-binding protein
MRTIALSLVVVLAAGGFAPVRAASDDHAGALAALADVRAAVAEIVHIEDGYAVGHGAYLRAAHRAMNALVGRRDDGYAKSFGDPGDGVGTLGHLDQILDKVGTSPWTPAIQGAKANVLAAAENLQSAFAEKEMEEYQADLTRTLASLALVVGRPSENGVLGGLSGALANTALAVPAGGTTLSGCNAGLDAARHAPVYGVAGGRLTYVALPSSTAAVSIPAGLNIDKVQVQSGVVVLFTLAAPERAALCGRGSPMQGTRETTARHLQRTRSVAVTVSAVPYTAAQAHAGIAVYRQSCRQCHNADLQGSAGPSVAGKDFLTTATNNKWSLSDMRTTVFENMPFSNPGSLSPAQYANVMAFLLASNCLPSSAKPFPTANSPSLATIKFAALHPTKPTNAKLGTCTVK